MWGKHEPVDPLFHQWNCSMDNPDAQLCESRMLVRWTKNEMWMLKLLSWVHKNMWDYFVFQKTTIGCDMCGPYANIRPWHGASLSTLFPHLTALLNSCRSDACRKVYRPLLNGPVSETDEIQWWQINEESYLMALYVNNPAHHQVHCLCCSLWFPWWAAQHNSDFCSFSNICLWHGLLVFGKMRGYARFFGCRNSDQKG